MPVTAPMDALYSFGVGSTGDPPVSVGDSPTEMAASSRCSIRNPSTQVHWWRNAPFSAIHPPSLVLRSRGEGGSILYPRLSSSVYVCCLHDTVTITQSLAAVKILQRAPLLRFVSSRHKYLGRFFIFRSVVPAPAALAETGQMIRGSVSSPA